MTYGMGPYPQQVASSGGRNMFSDIYDNFNTAVSGFGSKARTAGGAASGAVGNAMNGARGAYGAVQKFIPAAGGALAVIGGGLEAKARMDRGEDGQRAATGGLATTLGGIGGGAIGLLSGNPLIAAAASAAGSSAAGWVNDRVTDLVRGNDGKGTDAVVADMNGQIADAQNRGDYNRASQLMTQQGQFVSGRQKQNESPYMQGNRADAGGYGVGPDGMPAFNAAKNMAGIGSMQSDMAFNTGLGQDRLAYNQRLSQEKTTNAYQDPRLEMIRQQIANTSRASQIALDQSKMIAGNADRMNNASMAALHDVYSTSAFAPR